MALNSKYVQEIGLRFNGDQVFSSMTALGRKLENVVAALDKVGASSGKMSKKAEQDFNMQLKGVQQLISQIGTLDKLMNAAGSRHRNSLFSALDEANIGKKALSASMLKRELAGTEKASIALEVRLGQLHKRFGALADAGRKIGQNDMAKALNTAQAIKEAKKLEQQIERINARTKNAGGGSKELQTQQGMVQSQYDKLLRSVQNGRRSNWTTEIVQLEQLIQKYHALSKAEAAAAAQSERATNKLRNSMREHAKLTDAQMRAQVNRGAGGFQYGPDQAQRMDGQRLSKQLEKDMAQMARLQALMARAGEGAGSAYSLNRLAASYDLLKNRMADATAQLRAFQKAQATSGDVTPRLLTQTMSRVNMIEPQIRALGQRASGGFKYTPDQARTFDMNRIGAQLDQNMVRAQRLQGLMSQAVADGRPAKVLERLSKSWEGVIGRIGEATAQQKAFNNLPEQRMSRMNESLFGGGNWKQFSARIAGASVISAGVFAGMNAVTGSANEIVQIEDALARLQAIAGATGPEMANLGKTIAELATQSRYSALEIVEAATQIAQAGFTSTETAQVLESSLMLAAGSGSTVAEGVDVMTGALGAFQLQASEAGQVADSLMEGLNRSKLSVNQMQAALQYAGATAKETGMDLNELIAISASLANAGIRTGSTIGTGVRQLIVDLQTPSAKFVKELQSIGLTMADVDIRTQSLASVVNKLTDAGFSAEAAYASFEVRAASAFLAFRGQLDSYDSLAMALTQQGAAATAAERANDSLLARWQMLKNEGLKLAGEIGGPLLTALSGFVDLTSTAIGAVNGVVSVIGLLTSELGIFGEILLGPVALGLAGFAIGGPVGAAIGGLYGLLAAIGGVKSASEELTAATSKSQQELKSSDETIAALDQAMTRLIQRESSLRSSKAELSVEVLNLTSKFSGLATEINTTKLGYDELVSSMLKYRGVALAEQAELARETVRTAGKERDPLMEQYQSSRSILSTRATQASKDRLFGTETQSLLGQIGSYTSVAPNFDKMSEEQYTRYRTDLHRYENLLNEHVEKLTGTTKTQAQVLANELGRLRDRAAQIGGLTMNIRAGQRTVDFNQAETSADGQQRSRTVVELRQQAAQGLNANRGSSGSGDQSLRATTQRANAEIDRLRKRLANENIDGAGRDSVERTITDLTAIVSSIGSASDRATESMNKGERAAAGETLTGAQVKPLIESQFSGAKVTSWEKRSYAEQVRLYNNYKAGKGPLAAKPGSSNHGTGNAIDMRPIPGVEMDQVTKFLESRGLEVTEALRERNPTTGGYHWHFAWKSKTSSYQKQQDSEAEKAAREMQQLMERQAARETGAAKTRVQTTIKQAKAGNVPVEDLKRSFDASVAEYHAKALREFDVKNSTEGMSSTQKQIVADDLKALNEKLEAEVAGMTADFFREVSDAAFNAFNRAIAESERVLEAAMRKAEELRRGAQRRIDQANNRYNRHDTGAGTQYRLEQEQEEAERQSALDTIAANRTQQETAQAEVDKLQAQLAKLPEGSDKADQLNQLRDAQEKLRGAIEATNAAQADFDARFGQVENLTPMGDRVRDATRAWLENSGAMDTWAKQVENSVGPALDNITDGFTDLFTSIFNGSKSFGAALKDMLRNFGQFVVQMIARALALRVVKEILGAIGLGGGPNPGLFDGGVPDYSINNLKSSEKNPGLYGGGAVTRGVSNRDSATYDLAYGEYVVRNKSVRELGLPFMDAINKHGADGLAAMGSAGQNLTAIQAPRQETNVYVVQEKNRPPLGKNDILVTIQEDILQGGVTKKLVQQVAQGA